MQSHHEQETQEFILGKPKLGKNLATLSLEEVQQVQKILSLQNSPMNKTLDKPNHLSKIERQRQDTNKSKP